MTTDRTGKFLWMFLLSLFLIGAVPSQAQTITSNDPNGGPVDYATFRDPPREYWGHAWFTFNLGYLTEDRVESMIQRAACSTRSTPTIPRRAWRRSRRT